MGNTAFDAFMISAPITHHQTLFKEAYKSLATLQEYKENFWVFRFGANCKIKWLCLPLQR